MTNRTDDAWWDDVVEQLDFDAGDLQDAEARLRDGADAPVEPALVERVVRHATHRGPTLRLHRPPVRRRSKVAALVLGGALLAAATTFYLVWEAGRDSRLTMPYAMQLELLESSDQPDQHRHTAMVWVAGRVARAIVTLQSIRDDASAPQTLAEGARQGLTRLFRLLAVEPPQRLRVFHEDLDAAATRACDPALGMEVRARELERVVMTAGSEIGELRAMGTASADLNLSRDRQLANIRRLLNR